MWRQTSEKGLTALRSWSKVSNFSPCLCSSSNVLAPNSRVLAAVWEKRLCHCNIILQLFLSGDLIMRSRSSDKAPDLEITSLKKRAIVSIATSKVTFTCGTGNCCCNPIFWAQALYVRDQVQISWKRNFPWVAPSMMICNNLVVLVYSLKHWEGPHLICRLWNARAPMMMINFVHNIWLMTINSWPAQFPNSRLSLSRSDTQDVFL